MTSTGNKRPLEPLTPDTTPKKIRVFSENSIFGEDIEVVDLCEDIELPYTPSKSRESPSKSKTILTELISSADPEHRPTCSSTPTATKVEREASQLPSPLATPGKREPSSQISPSAASRVCFRVPPDIEQVTSLFVPRATSSIEPYSRRSRGSSSPVRKKRLYSRDERVFRPANWKSWTPKEYVELSEALFANFHVVAFAEKHQKSIQEVRDIASAVIFRPLLDAAEATQRGEAGMKRLSDLYEKYGGKRRIWAKDTPSETRGYLSRVRIGCLIVIDEEEEEVSLVRGVLNGEDFEFLDGVLLQREKRLLDRREIFVPDEN